MTNAEIDERYYLLLRYEPLSALDLKKRPIMSKELGRLIHEQQVSSIIVTHNHRDIAEVGDRVCLLKRGETALICGIAEDPAAEGSGLFDDGDDL
ncbi:hypothetical protein P0O24_03945 [Methanotrichaceae archaeon M04Ac]|jgi:ABC-type sulfate/molybdate transport systems ATPase subunit|uniref:ABC transporter ATP-binding protein n=1 Tax=Candidatus Methanocrinis alkalitolerans TaxID=3033395 RepID=A0ABT5XDK0_9EURY|nr:hypothetical protein [Candidatus Methanocrinis alkalitolerans]MCR3884056.1 hypothetical protein [Methanothrix sp.]MDF0592731.1 hypothetical protein [Candidatus Methanocrinis alkalitolerans]